ncbi:MAG: desA, partial [Actinomycetia bacterium]|nr:desA [Actinomycetes bacterium]
LFYRDLVTAAIDIDPDAVVFGIEHQVLEFAMPGTGIADFAAHAKLIANAGIYDFRSHHDQILVPVVLRHWKLESIEGLSPEAEAARDRILAYINRIGKIARRLSERREAAALSSV